MERSGVKPYAETSQSKKITYIRRKRREKRTTIGATNGGVSRNSSKFQERHPCVDDQRKRTEK